MIFVASQFAKNLMFDLGFFIWALNRIFFMSMKTCVDGFNHRELFWCFRCVLGPEVT